MWLEEDDMSFVLGKISRASCVLQTALEIINRNLLLEKLERKISRKPCRRLG